MTISGASEYFASAVGASNVQHLMAGAVPAGAYISKIDVEGYANVEQGFFSLATGQYSTYDIVAGVQFGAAGYTPPAITDGTAAGATWYSFGNLIPAALANQILPGSSPQNMMLGIGFPLNLSLRQYIYVPTSTDVYLVIGCDTSRTFKPTYEAFFTTNVEWATYP